MLLLQAVYKAYAPDGSMTLQHFIIIFGVLQLLLSQLPNIHSLRMLNLLSTIATLGFATVATGAATATAAAVCGAHCIKHCPSNMCVPQCLPVLHTLVLLCFTMCLKAALH